MENELPFKLPEFKVDELKQDDTNLGTFKSVKSLKDAYDSLRSCFTKNAMELAEIKKNMQQNNENIDKKEEVFAKTDTNVSKIDQNDQNQAKNSDLNDFRQEILQSNELDIIQKTKKGEDILSDKVDITPDKTILDKAESPQEVKPNVDVWENADWNSKVERFFELYPDAKVYSKELAQILVNDKTVRKSESPLTNAWIKILQNNKHEIKLDNEFISKNVLNNPKIYNLVVNDYLSKLKTNKSAPSVIANVEGASVSAGVHKTVANMAEAKELAKKFFK